MTRFVFLLLFLAVHVLADDYKLSIKSDRDWKLKINEPVQFSVCVMQENPLREVKGKKVSYIVKVDGMEKASGTLLSGGSVKYSVPHPGWINVQFSLLDDSGKVVEFKDKNGKTKPVSAGMGALVEPEKLRPGMKKPDDFDAFWDEQRKILDKVPLKAKLTEVEPSPQQKGRFRCYDVQVDCAGGMPVSGYLCVPRNAKNKSLPAVVSFHGAGVRSSIKSTQLTPALYLDINSHGIPNGKPLEYYRALAKNELRSYWNRGAGDRETFYFRGMFFRVMRALDYIKSRPEWNGKVLIVQGMSMGGAQALAAAALDPQVTLCTVSVPALMDHGGSLAVPAREPGWPRLFDVRKREPDPARMKTAPYYDNIFLSDRIKAEVFLSTGLNDFICCPTSIFVLYNRLGVKKSIEVYPAGNHYTSYSALWKERYNELLAQ